MTQRRIPVGDPRLKGMNDTQWVFELEAANMEEQKKYDELKTMAQMVKSQVAHMLGVNLMPVEDEKTGLLRMPEETEMLPLMLGMGNAEIIKVIMEKRQEYFNQEEQRNALGTNESPGFGQEPVNEMTPEQLEEFMKGDGDIEFDDVPSELVKAMSWGSPESQMLLENLVLAKEDVDPTALNPQIARTIGQARRDLLKKKPKEEEHVESLKIKIESDSILANIPEKKRKSSVTLEILED